jgi:hypothetical protein
MELHHLEPFVVHFLHQRIGQLASNERLANARRSLQDHGLLGLQPLENMFQLLLGQEYTRGNDRSSMLRAAYGLRSSSRIWSVSLTAAGAAGTIRSPAPSAIPDKVPQSFGVFLSL